MGGVWGVRWVTWRSRWVGERPGRERERVEERGVAGPVRGASLRGLGEASARDVRVPERLLDRNKKRPRTYPGLFSVVTSAYYVGVT